MLPVLYRPDRNNVTLLEHSRNEDRQTVGGEAGTGGGSTRDQPFDSTDQLLKLPGARAYRHRAVTILEGLHGVNDQQNGSMSKSDLPWMPAK